MMRPLHVSLIDGPTQSAKTWKVFEILADQTIADASTLVVFATQANNTTMSSQVVARARQNARIASLFPWIGDTHFYERDVYRTKQPCPDVLFLVDFWHKKKRLAMLKAVRARSWNHVFVVIDEADQGSLHGVRDRFAFLDRIDRALDTSTSLHVLLVTATVPHLCKCIHAIALQNERGDITQRIVRDDNVCHYYVKPQDVYVGPAFYGLEDEGAHWSKIKIQPRQKNETKQSFMTRWKTATMESIDLLPREQKRLSLLMISTVTREQIQIAKNLLGRDRGFNVTVQLNALQNKCFTVLFRRDTDQTIHTWNIPLPYLEKCADRQTVFSEESCVKSRLDLSIPDVLQACLVMGTAYEEPFIRARMAKQASPPSLWKKLQDIFALVSASRPPTYPENPHIAIIAGHIAGRGMTLQNPQIAFVCTSFCFMGGADYAMRGAQNAQKLGRACGHLLPYHQMFAEKPKILTTENVMNDALSNAQAVREDTHNKKIALRDFVSDKEWKDVYRSHRTIIENKREDVSSVYQTAAAPPQTGPLGTHDKMEYLTRIFCEAYPRALTLSDVRRVNPKFYDEFVARQHRQPIHALYHRHRKIDRIGNKYVFVP